MKDLIKQYLDHGISRRQLMSGLSAVGMSTVAAKAMAQSLAPFAASAQAATPQGPLREMTGTGGERVFHISSPVILLMSGIGGNGVGPLMI